MKQPVKLLTKPSNASRHRRKKPASKDKGTANEVKRPKNGSANTDRVMDCEPAQMISSGGGNSALSPYQPSTGWVAWKQGVITTVIAVFYTALIIVSILVCVYSVHSIFIASNTPVTSTRILEQLAPFEPPVLLLFIPSGSAHNCSCEYYNYTMSSRPRNCSAHTVFSTNKRYMEHLTPDIYARYKDQVQLRQVIFLYFRGPRYWYNQEALEVDCELPLSEAKKQIEYLFLPNWHEFQAIEDEKKDLAIYAHLKKHPGMRFFPFGFENFVIISRTEIREADQSVKPIIRLETETSLSLVDKAGFIGESETNVSKIEIGVQWKDGYVTDVRSFISASIWSAVSVVSTMLLMLEKAYGFATRIYASVKSDREKKKIYKQHQQRVMNETVSNTVVVTSAHGNRKKDSSRSAAIAYGRDQNLDSPAQRNSSFTSNKECEPLCNRYALGNAQSGVEVGKRRLAQRPSHDISNFDMMRIDRNLNEIDMILQSYNMRIGSGSPRLQRANDSKLEFANDPEDKNNGPIGPALDFTKPTACNGSLEGSRDQSISHI